MRDPARPFRIAVASGKGGSGKTIVALHLAWTFAEAGATVALCDCDAEAPDCACFFQNLQSQVWQPVSELRPTFDPASCTGCGACAQACTFNALAMVRSQPRVFTELCHGCGVCALVCPMDGAIVEQPQAIGDTAVSEVTLPDGHRFSLVSGRTLIGSTRTPAVIAACLKRTPANATVQIRDSAPGTACPAVAGMRGADAALLVTEATPFGLHDLRLSVELARSFALPLAVVVNRADDDRRVQDWCAEEGIAVLAELPDDRRVAEAYAEGRFAGEAVPGYLDRFLALRQRIGEVWMQGVTA